MDALVVPADPTEPARDIDLDPEDHQKLPEIADHIMQWTGLRVMRPTTYWDLLAPWTALYC